MNIGLVTAARYQHYGPFWQAFIAGLGLKFHTPETDVATALGHGAQLLPDERPSIQLMAAQAMELAPNVDVLLVPDLNPGAADSPNAGDLADPWAVDAAAILSRRFTLPQTIGVPTSVNEKTSGLAVRLGQAWMQNAQLVRRALDRNQHLLKELRPTEPRWQMGGAQTIGVVADPNLLESPVWQELWAKQSNLPAGNHYLPITDLPRERLLELGKARAAREPRLQNLSLTSELEMLGGLSVLETKGQVHSLLLVTEPRATRQARLLDILAELSEKTVNRLDMTE